MRKIEYDVARPIALKIQVICTSSTGGEGVAPSKTTSEFVRKQCLLVAFAMYAGGTLVDVWRGGGGGGVKVENDVGTRTIRCGLQEPP